MGPKQKEFSVKDREEFEFKPHMILTEIVQIYLNLEADRKFCLAVINDERSFTPQLLTSTATVLQKISQSPKLIADFMAFEDKIKVRHIFSA